MTTSRSLLKRSLLLALATAVSGCTVGPDYHAPKTNAPAAFSATTQPAATQPATQSATQPATQAATQPATQPAAVAVDLTRWWETFNDPVLNRLIAESAAANLNVRLAQARVLEARENLSYNRAGLFPTLDATGSATRSRASRNGSGILTSNANSSGGTGGTTGGTGGTGGTSGGGGGATSGSTGTIGRHGDTNLFQAGFDAGWEVDIFGGTRRAIEAAQYSFEAQVEARRNALVTLLAEVAQNYIQLRGYQHELAIIRENIAAQRDTLGIQQTKLEAGIATDLTVAQAESLVATTESQIPGLETNIQQAIHRISVLMDREPSALLAELALPARLPSGPPAILPGLPSELLRRRPDVRQAERQLAAATANIGVATADYFPRLNLTGSAGLQSLRIENFTDARSLFYSFGPSVSWRIFDAGQIGANVRIENARQQEALIQYRQAVLTSFEDVENALVAYNREQARRAALQRAVDANRRATDLARQLNDAGVVDFLNVLTAEQSLYQSQDQLAQSDQAVSTDLVALYKALGGGWETTESAGNAKGQGTVTNAARSGAGS